MPSIIVDSALPGMPAAGWQLLVSNFQLVAHAAAFAVCFKVSLQSLLNVIPSWCGCCYLATASSAAFMSAGIQNKGEPLQSWL